MTSITLRIPVDVVDSMKTIAPRKGFSGYQALLKAYISQRLRRDEAFFSNSKELQLIAALKNAVFRKLFSKKRRGKWHKKLTSIDSLWHCEFAFQAFPV